MTERPRVVGILSSSKTVTATEGGLLFGRLSPLQEPINAVRKENRRMRFILFLGRSGKSASSVRERGWKKKSLLVRDKKKTGGDFHSLSWDAAGLSSSSVPFRTGAGIRES